MIVTKKNNFYTKIESIEIDEITEIYKHFRLEHKTNLVKNINWLKFFSDGCIQILTKDFKLITYNDYLDNQIMISRFKKDLRHLINLD